MVAEVLSEIEEEAAAKRGDRPVLGVERIRSQDPARRPPTTKKSPAPMLFFAKRKEVCEAQANRYLDFVDEYERAADRLIQAALQGDRLDPSRHFPKGSFPPAVIEELQKAADGSTRDGSFRREAFQELGLSLGADFDPRRPSRRLGNWSTRDRTIRRSYGAERSRRFTFPARISTRLHLPEILP